MRRPSVLTGILALAILASTARADESAAVAHDRAAYAGTWLAVAIEVDGNEQATRERKIVVVNREDGSWTMAVDGREVSSGTSSIDPLATPPAIDIEIIAGDGAGSTLLGIYEVGGNRRRLCFRGAGEWRPQEFATAFGNKAVLVTFERE
ncbi:MAG: TIGR03067 domain-containing protein [Planctomycetota bacterium]